MSRIVGCAWFAGLAILAGARQVVVPADLSTASGIVSYAVDWIALAFLLVIVGLLLGRQEPALRAKGWKAYLAAICGTNLILVSVVLSSPRPGLGVGLQVLSASLMLIGNLLAVVTLVHLGRSFSIVAEARQLVTDGPYRLIRHPLYVAEQIGVIGLFVKYASLEMAVIFLIHAGFQIQRMLVEEDILTAAFPEYEAYKRRTHRAVPGLW